MITLYDQQSVKSFPGTSWARLYNEGTVLRQTRRDADIRARTAARVGSFMKACFLEHPPTHTHARARLTSSPWQRDVIFIHARRASHARRRFLTHVSHTRRPVLRTDEVRTTARCSSRPLIVIEIARTGLELTRRERASLRRDRTYKFEVCTLKREEEEEGRASVNEMGFHEWQYRAEIWLGVGRARDKLFQASMHVHVPESQSRVVNVGRSRLMRVVGRFTSLWKISVEKSFLRTFSRVVESQKQRS